MHILGQRLPGWWVTLLLQVWAISWAEVGFPFSLLFLLHYNFFLPQLSLHSRSLA